MVAVTIRVACVGAGYFSRFHLESWARMQDVTVVGVCDRNIDAARKTGAPAFADLHGMLDETAPDVLDIVLPPAAHADSIRTALAAGIRWIVCQKPFCQDLDEARAMAEAAEAEDATLIVHENFRFQPWYRAMRDHIASGALGTVQNATFRLRPGDVQGPRAYLDRQPYFQRMPRFLVHETAVHWIDTFQFLFGPVRSVYADLRRLNPAVSGEDAGHVIFDHDNGMRALFDGNRHLDHASDNTRRTMGEALVEGTGGTLTLTGDGQVTHRPFGAQKTTQVLPPCTHDGFGGDCVHALNSHVITAMQGAGRVENKARDYLSVLAVEAAIYRSAETGQRMIL